MDKFMKAAIAEARKGLRAGGVPIGSVLVLDGRIIGRGHNQRVQKKSPILHGEMAALEDAQRRTAAEYRRATIYTTLSPCSMCTGAILLYRIPRVVIAENTTFMGAEKLLKRAGVELVFDREAEPICRELMRKFIAAKPEIWNEDIGEP